MKKKTTSQLKKELDRVFSIYIRSKDTIKGNAKCVTCGSIKPWKEMQAGHYVPRQHLAVRYDERNVHVQCVGCNIFKKGNMTSYALFMLETYGLEVMAVLERKKQEITKNYPYEEKIAHYQKKQVI